MHSAPVKSILAIKSNFNQQSVFWKLLLMYEL